MPRGLAGWGRLSWGSSEFPALAFFGIGIITHLIMTQTSLGTYWYAIGGNSDASHRAGLSVNLIFALSFVVAGLCSGIAGVLLASRAVSANPGVGRDTALFAISATVIGGTSLFGGVGNVHGAVAGVMFLGVVRNSLNLPRRQRLLAMGHPGRHPGFRCRFRCLHESQTPNGLTAEARALASP